MLDRITSDALRSKGPGVLIGLLLLALVAGERALPARKVGKAPTGEQPHARETTSQKDSDVQAPEPGRPIERELAGGEAHSDPLTPLAGQIFSRPAEPK